MTPARHGRQSYMCLSCAASRFRIFTPILTASGRLDELGCRDWRHDPLGYLRMIAARTREEPRDTSVIASFHQALKSSRIR